MLCLNITFKKYSSIWWTSQSMLVLSFKASVQVQLCTSLSTSGCHITNPLTASISFYILIQQAKKDENHISKMASVELYKERSCYLQCNSSKLAVRPNHSTPQQRSVSRAEAHLLFTNEGEERCSKGHPLSQPTTDADDNSK